MLFTSTMKTVIFVSLALASNAFGLGALPPQFQEAAEEQRIRDSPHMKEMIGSGPMFGITSIESVPRISQIADIDGYVILSQYKVSTRTHGEDGWMTQQGYIKRDFTVYSVASKAASPDFWGPIEFALLFEDMYVEDPAAGQSGYINGPAPIEMTFNQRVARGVDIVKKQYPKAKLYEADGTSRNLDGELDHLRIVFRGQEDNTTIVITEKSAGVFGEPRVIDSPFMECVVIEWPIKMDLPKATQLLEAAGYTDKAFTSTVTLRNVLGPRRENPMFFFGYEEVISVDTVTGKVESVDAVSATRKAADVPADCNGVKPIFPPIMPGPVIINKMIELDASRKVQCLPNKDVTGYITEHRIVGTPRDEPAPIPFRSADKSVVTCELVNTTPRGCCGGEIYEQQFIAQNFGRTTVTNGSRTYTIQVGLL